MDDCSSSHLSDLLTLATSSRVAFKSASTAFIKANAYDLETAVTQMRENELVAAEDAAKMRNQFSANWNQACQRLLDDMNVSFFLASLKTNSTQKKPLVFCLVSVTLKLRVRVSVGFKTKDSRFYWGRKVKNSHNVLFSLCFRKKKKTMEKPMVQEGFVHRRISKDKSQSKRQEKREQKETESCFGIWKLKASGI